jgi:hypothetical protein
MSHKQRGHTRLIHADADPVASYARLRNFKDRIANAILITDADLMVREPLDREVFAELTEAKIAAAEEALPVMVGVHLVGKYGAVFPSVTFKIGLRVTVDIECADRPASNDRIFPNGSSDGFAVPCHFARKTNVYCK